MYYDDLLSRYLGDFGRYQSAVFLAVSLSNIPIAFNTMGIVFLAGVPDHWCYIPQLGNTTAIMNLTDDNIKDFTVPVKDGNYDNCRMYAGNYSNGEEVLRRRMLGEKELQIIPCQHGWVYSRDVYTSTIVTQWDLVCDRSVIPATMSSVYMAGFMIGVALSGNISDALGRRPVYIVTLVLLLITNTITAFAPNPTTFTIFRFLSAVANMGASSTGYVIATEIMGPSWRAHAGMFYMYFWAAGYMMFAGFAFFIREWKTLLLVSSCACVPLLITVFFLPESPRWLYTRGKRSQADKIVHKMAKVNKREIPEDLNITIKTNRRGYFVDLWRHPKMRLRTLNVMYCWFVSSLVYYGLSLNTSNLGGNDFLNFAISGAVEIPAYIISQAALVHIGRRIPLAVSLIVGGVCLLASIPIPKNLLGLSLTLAMLGKFCISGSFAMVGIVTLEVFPTVTRHVGLATGSVSARVGGILAPYITLLDNFGYWIPMVIFGSLSVIAGGLSFLFPETKDTKLAETVEDGERLGTQ